MAKYILICVVLALTLGCTGNDRRTVSDSVSQARDTVYTQEAAMMVYDYDPVRALLIIDSAVIVGNLNPWQAGKNRARIYSQTRLGERLDSLMHWTKGARLDSARAIGERLLKHDYIKNSLEGQQDVLEILAYTARQQNDTTTWLRRSRQLVDVCRRQGAETEALRNEAEVGAALCWMGRQTEGMALLDSTITALSEKGAMKSEESATAACDGFKFNELDALVIALKRKIGVMSAAGLSAEMLPLARRIVTLLDDYEQHPEQYHDGTYREPTIEKRNDYVRFYRSQAQNFIAAAYTALGQTDDMKATFEHLENIVREAETREHHARYHALNQQMEAARQRADARRNALIASGTIVVALLTLCFALYYRQQQRIVSQKNHALVRQIDEAMAYKVKYEALRSVELANLAESAQPALDTLRGGSNPDVGVFARIRDAIIREQLYLDPACDRQMLTNRFQLSKERLGSLFAQYSEAKNISAFINALRLDHASRLLTSQPDIDIRQVAMQSGFSSHQYFSNCFKQRFGLSPTDYRRAKHL